MCLLGGLVCSCSRTELNVWCLHRFGAGAFYGASVLATAPTCPFPEEWQFNTIPESIENDDDID